VFKPVEDGRVIAYLISVSADEIVYDQAQWRADCEAEIERRAQNDGDRVVYEHNVEDICVTNDQSWWRRAPVADDVVVRSAPDGDPPAQEDLAWLGDFVARTPDGNHWLYWLTIEHGTITRIEQVNPSSA
jgi:hypothetical protein